ncbi:tRNA pseudouridine(38-40) synthase TruA [Leifsonia sp. NPDC080035]|uniref:tRNA pseudouridine synthase A n=1 Tax=Leifsonia sp. NPDC080035 TaxID=3143936 RepID=A0AAU7GFK4_9MICO
MTEQATRFRLDIAYQGTDFNGWGRQPDQRTVQGTLEAALATIFRRAGEPPTLTVAGRTDAGVHATGQVAHVDLDPGQVALLRKPHGKRPPLEPADALARRVNGVLGPVPDVVVLRASEAPAGFDARFSALWRRYEYRVADRAALRDPLQRHRTAWVASTLDVDGMDLAAHGLLGLHDFASYCKAREGATTIRTLQAFSWRRDDDGVLVGEVGADAFCHSMVRALVGACVEVGEGKLTPGDLVRLRDEQRRTSAFKVMPARGLTLLEVGYPPDAELATRAEQTRGMRTL